MAAVLVSSALAAQTPQGPGVTVGIRFDEPAVPAAAPAAAAPEAAAAAASLRYLSLLSYWSAVNLVRPPLLVPQTASGPGGRQLTLAELQEQLYRDGGRALTVPEYGQPGSEVVARGGELNTVPTPTSMFPVAPQAVSPSSTASAAPSAPAAAMPSATAAAAPSAGAAVASPPPTATDLPGAAATNASPESSAVAAPEQPPATAGGAPSISSPLLGTVAEIARSGSTGPGSAVPASAGTTALAPTGPQSGVSPPGGEDALKTGSPDEPAVGSEVSATMTPLVRLLDGFGHTVRGVAIGALAIALAIGTSGSLIWGLKRRARRLRERQPAGISTGLPPSGP